MLEQTLIHQRLRLFSDLIVPEQVLDTVHAAILVMSYKSSFLELRRSATSGQVQPAHVRELTLHRDLLILQLHILQL
jgi:hypothetical protein